MSKSQDTHTHLVLVLVALLLLLLLLVLLLFLALSAKRTVRRMSNAKHDQFLNQRSKAPGLAGDSAQEQTDRVNPCKKTHTNP